MNKPTDSGEQTSDWLVVLITNDLVRTNDTATYTLNNADLASALVLELTQAEWESAELLDDLGQSSPGTRSLESVCSIGTSVKGGAVAKVLDLSGSETDADLDTPSLSKLRKSVTTNSLTRSEDELLLALNVVAVKQPASVVLDKVDVVGLAHLGEQVVHLVLAVWLLCLRLGLFLVCAGRQSSRWDHHAEKKFVAPVCGQKKVGLASRKLVIRICAGWDDDGVADDGTETVDLCTQLDLDNLASLECSLRLFCVRLQWGVWSDICAW